MIRRSLVLLLLALQQLPPPFHTPWYRKITKIVPQPEGAPLKIPPGFRVNLFADKLEHARWMALAPNGDVFLAESGFGKITVLGDTDSDGVADLKETFASGLNRPFGLAFRDGYLYVGNNDAVVRFPYKPGQLKAESDPEKIVELPASSGGIDRDTAERLKIPISQTRGYNHWTRNLIFSADGKKMYVTVGSATNDTPEEDPRRAAINEFNPDGTGHRILCNGSTKPCGPGSLSGNQHAVDIGERARSTGG